MKILRTLGLVAACVVAGGPACRGGASGTGRHALQTAIAVEQKDDRELEGEVDRYISRPGQATSYMLGRLEILRLRQMAKDSRGTRFDIRQFHDQVLGAGNISLPILRARVEHWIAISKHK